jgi:mRNA interferase RelE/StbE
MIYELTYSECALKQLKKLEKNIQLRVLASLERCRINPYPHLKKLVGSPYFRLRVGDYRIILNINDNEVRILVIEIGHRKNIYDKS